MSISRKKVIVRTVDGEFHRGYLPAIDLAPAGLLDLLLLDGIAAPIALNQVRHVAFVKDFNVDDQENPERVGMRSFASKPRGSGLCVRIEFADGSTQEGLLPAGLPLLDSLLLDRGIFLEPPEKSSNTQRLFVPRSSFIAFETLGMVGRGVATAKRALPPVERQGALFPSPGEN